MGWSKNHFPQPTFKVTGMFMPASITFKYDTQVFSAIYNFQSRTIASLTETQAITIMHGYSPFVFCLRKVRSWEWHRYRLSCLKFREMKLQLNHGLTVIFITSLICRPKASRESSQKSKTVSSAKCRWNSIGPRTVPRHTPHFTSDFLLIFSYLLLAHWVLCFK